MTEISQTILDTYQVRKSKKQKDKFITYLQSNFTDLKVESYKHSNSRNLILGDPTDAKVLVSAHYDTCAQLPIPNFVTPLNPPLTIIYGLVLIIPIFLIVFALNFLLSPFISSFALKYWISFALIYYITILGPANPHTVNDNTSGVIALCELYQRLTEEERKSVCIIFFDNEEKGLLGSSAYKKKYKKEIKKQLLINLDCISDGDHLLLAMSKKTREIYQPIIETGFQDIQGKKILLKNAEKVYYPSDQAGFPVSIAVAALKYKKYIGYYMDRIHTKRDTVMDERNITSICSSITKIIQNIKERADQ